MTHRVAIYDLITCSHIFPVCTRCAIELANVAPALYRAAREQGARVALAHSEVRRRRDAGHVDGGGALGGGSVAELAVVVRDARFHEIIRTGDSNT